MDSAASQRARIAAYTRRAFDLRFEREVAPDGSLSPAVRRTLAERARKAYFARLAYASAQARRHRR